MPFLLDTVTVSELRRNEATMDPGVWQWQQGIGEAWLSVITLNEIIYGIRKVERKDPVFAARLTAWYAHILAQSRRFPVLDVTRAIAEHAANLRAALGLTSEDSLIAATAKIHELTLVTRSIADFQECGIELVNPWEVDEDRS